MELSKIRFQGCIQLAVCGDTKPLAKYIASGDPLDPEDRKVLADYVAGRLKRGRGDRGISPVEAEMTKMKKWMWDAAYRGKTHKYYGIQYLEWHRYNVTFGYAAIDVARYKQVWRKRYKRKNPLQAAALAAAAKRNGVDEDKLSVFINR